MGVIFVTHLSSQANFFFHKLLVGVIIMTKKETSQLNLIIYTSRMSGVCILSFPLRYAAQGPRIDKKKKRLEPGSTRCQILVPAKREMRLVWTTAGKGGTRGDETGLERAPDSLVQSTTERDAESEKKRMCIR